MKDTKDKVFYIVGKITGLDKDFYTKSLEYIKSFVDKQCQVY